MMQTLTSPAPARVLVVDDEEVIREALEATLAAEGYDVLAAANPTAALQLLHEQTFALVLTDQRMPGMTGLEFLRQVQRLQPEATRVLMTGVLELGTLVDCINKGDLYRFIVKPWLREELLATVRNGLQRRELMVRNAELQRATQLMNEKLIELNHSLEKQISREAEQNHQLADLNRALEQNLHRSVELCLKTMRTFYPRLGVQAQRVAELCQCVAAGLNLPAKERQVLDIAALLHDVGLVGVPRRLITLWQKTPTALNKAERTLIEQHPIMGEELAGFVQQLADVGRIIRAHHERFDGSGFPDQVEGEQIPWLARLLAVVVGFVETEARSGDGLGALREGSGTAYDPEAVRAFIRHRPQSASPRQEREVPMSELAPGMVLAKGIYTASGVLLMPEGQLLSEIYINKLKSHNRINPIRQSLVVYC